MNWIDKIKSQLTRIFGADFSEELTEAELIDKLESIEGISDLRTQIKDQEDTITAQNASMADLATKMSAIDVSIQSLTEALAAVKAENASAISNLQSQFGNELNGLKMSLSGIGTQGNSGEGLPKFKERVKGPISGDGSFIMEKVRNNQPFKSN